MVPVSDSNPLLIPFASMQSDGCRQAMRELPLPHLEKLLAHLQPGDIDMGELESLSMPHERLLARAAGIEAADGCLPLAALQLAQAGLEAPREACAWITPCHWRVGTDHVAMANPGEMELTQADSMAVLAAIRPFFEEDGIAIEYESPLRWIARGEIFRALPTASLDRVAGRGLGTWMPRTPQAGALRRLQQEMQMLLYTHPVSDARQASGLVPVNSFWASGAGALPDGYTPAPAPRWRVDDRLRVPALKDDGAAWAAAWRDIDATELPRLLAALDAGSHVSLALCGERSAQAWQSRDNSGYWGKVGASLAGLLGRKQAVATLEAL